MSNKAGGAEEVRIGKKVEKLKSIKIQKCELPSPSHLKRDLPWQAAQRMRTWWRKLQYSWSQKSE
jgi:hypothetical protein